jgi:hypothetical protein
VNLPRQILGKVEKMLFSFIRKEEKKWFQKRKKQKLANFAISSLFVCDEEVIVLVLHFLFCFM